MRIMHAAQCAAWVQGSVAAGPIALRCCDGFGQLPSLCMQPSSLALVFHQETKSVLFLSDFAPPKITIS
jgi:hypothetical protein